MKRSVTPRPRIGSSPIASTVTADAAKPPICSIPRCRGAMIEPSAKTHRLRSVGGLLPTILGGTATWPSEPRVNQGLEVFGDARDFEMDREIGEMRACQVTVDATGQRHLPTAVAPIL